MKFEHQKGKVNLYQQKKAFGLEHKKVYTTAYGKLYFIIRDFLARVKQEGRELTSKDRDELLELAIKGLKDSPLYSPHKHASFVEKALSYVLGLLILNGDLPSGMIKQLEVLLCHDDLYNKALKRNDIRLAREINVDRMKVYRIMGNSNEPSPSSFLGIKIDENGKGVLAMGTPEECLQMVKQALMPSEKKAIPMNIEIKEES